MHIYPCDFRSQHYGGVITAGRQDLRGACLCGLTSQRHYGLWASIMWATSAIQLCDFASQYYYGRSNTAT
ncbi:hypothetical protein ACIO6T_19720 [Streptomyces sp. NPDC087532]|uniref:hypothetical protein n=1 Tax=unclassified Streptomyces TaxID=2593676 RepID=UPI00331727E6